MLQSPLTTTNAETQILIPRPGQPTDTQYRNTENQMGKNGIVRTRHYELLEAMWPDKGPKGDRQNVTNNTTIMDINRYEGCFQRRRGKRGLGTIAQMIARGVGALIRAAAAPGKLARATFMTARGSTATGRAIGFAGAARGTGQMAGRLNIFGQFGRSMDRIFRPIQSKWTKFKEVNPKTASALSTTVAVASVTGTIWTAADIFERIISDHAHTEGDIKWTAAGINIKATLAKSLGCTAEESEYIFEKMGEAFIQGQEGLRLLLENVRHVLRTEWFYDYKMNNYHEPIPIPPKKVNEFIDTTDSYSTSQKWAEMKPKDSKKLEDYLKDALSHIDTRRKRWTREHMMNTWRDMMKRPDEETSKPIILTTSRRKIEETVLNTNLSTQPLPAPMESLTLQDMVNLNKIKGNCTENTKTKEKICTVDSEKIKNILIGKDKDLRARRGTQQNCAACEENRTRKTDETTTTTRTSVLIKDTFEVELEMQLKKAENISDDKERKLEMKKKSDKLEELARRKLTNINEKMVVAIALGLALALTAFAWIALKYSRKLQALQSSHQTLLNDHAIIDLQANQQNH